MNAGKYLFLPIFLLSLYFYTRFFFQQVPREKSHWCFENSFLKSYNQQIIDEYELKWKDWNRKHFTNTFHYSKKYAQTSGKSTGDFPQIVYPSIPLLPCASLKRYGNSRATGKQLCGLDTLSKNVCIIYSLGSNNNFQFEDAILSQTSCRVHTFDCTSLPPKQDHPRLKFHQICLGEQSSLQESIYPQSGKKQQVNLTFMKFDRILQMNEHQRIHVLKMDIEGGEYSVFADLFENANRLELPFQISVESHWWNRDIYHSILHMSLFSQLFQNGYRLLQYELNEGDPSCVEWTFPRVFC